MAVIGTFGSYTAAILGIHSSQTAMNVTGNNIGNINTTGYTRQRVDQSSMYESGVPRYQNSYNINIGYGALVNQVTQLRDPFLDIRYRNENASYGYYESMQNGLKQLANILDEVGRGGEDEFGIIEAQLGDLKNMLRDLLEHPASTTQDDLVRGSANTLCTLLNSYAKELKQVHTSEEERMMDMKDEINSILSDIRGLNEQIRNQDIYGNGALELRDERNLKIDKLSKYMKINVSYSMEQINATTQIEKLTISLKNSKDYNWSQAQKEITLVDGLYAAQFDFGPADEKDPDVLMEQVIGEDNKPVFDQSDPPQPVMEVTGYRFYDIGILGKKDDDSKIFVTQAEFDRMDKATRDDKYKVIENDSYIDLPIGTTLAINPDYNPIYNKNVGKYLMDDGKPTDKLEEAAWLTSYQDEADDNRYIFRLTALTNKDGEVMNDEVPALMSRPVWLDDNDTFGSLQALRELLTEEGEFSSKLDVALDPNAATKHGIPYYQHMLDSFAQKIATQMNTANTLPDVNDYAKVYALTGTYKEIADPNDPNKKIPDPSMTFADKNSPDKDNPDPIKAKLTEMPDVTFKKSDGSEETLSISGGEDKITLELLQKLKKIITAAEDPDNPFPALKWKADGQRQVPDESDFEAYQAAMKNYQTCLDALRDNGTLTPEYTHYDGGVLFSNNGEGDDPSNITAENISVSQSWAHGRNRVLNTVEANLSYLEDGEIKYKDGTTRDDNIAHIISLWGQNLKYNAKDTVPDAVYNGKDFYNGSFQYMYRKATSTLAVDTRTVNLEYSTFSLTTLNLDNDRISVYGVDLNEEATNMMQYSQSFSAACKLLTTIDEMLDKLINGTI